MCEPLALAQRNAFQDPDSVSGQEPDSGAVSLRLTRQLPEQAVTVWLDDVC